MVLSNTSRLATSDFHILVYSEETDFKWKVFKKDNHNKENYIYLLTSYDDYICLSRFIKHIGHKAPKYI